MDLRPSVPEFTVAAQRLVHSPPTLLGSSGREGLVSARLGTGGLARPAGVGHALTTRIPIEGRDEWLAAAEAKSA